jgi:3-isopropylmalate dehydratase small subunit
MEPFRTIESVAASMPEKNIDTDIIFPARFLLILEKAGVGKYAFYEKRMDANGDPRPDHILNSPQFSSAQILIGGDNFGCGSSREQAVWTLADFGFRCVIAPRFGEIFYANCFKSGVLPVRLDETVLTPLRDEANAGVLFTIDLEQQVISTEHGAQHHFEIEPRRKEALVNGWDETDLILNNEAEAIAGFQVRQKNDMPWLYADE